MIFYFNFINYVLTIREVKMYIGWISGLSFLGAILAGALTKPLLSMFSMSYCLVLTGIVYIITLLPLAFSCKMETKAEKKKEEKPLIIKKLMGTNFVKLMILFVVVSGLIKYFVDFQFSHAIAGYFTDDTELAGFYGTFNAISMTLILISQVLFTGKILKVLSMSDSFKIISAILIFFSFICIFYPAFWLIIAFQFILILTLKIIAQPFRNVLMGAVAADIRSRVRFLIEGIFYCLGVMMTGILIALLNLFSLPSSVFFLIILLLSFVYLNCTGKIDRAYVEALIGNLKKKTRKSRDEIFNNIYNLNPHSGTALFSRLLNVVEVDTKLEALRGLSRLGTDEARDRIIEALDRESDLNILSRIIKFMGNMEKDDKILNKLMDMMENRKGRKITLRVIEVLAGWGDKGSLDIIYPYIFNKDSRIKSTSVLAILKLDSNIEQIKEAIGELLTMFNSEQSDLRASAVAILGELGLECFVPAVCHFYKDPSLKVRRNAVIASLKLRSPLVITDLSSMLEQEENEDIYILINKVMSRIKDDTFEEMMNIVTGLDFSCKQRVINSLRQIEDERALKLALKSFCLEPLTLSIKLVELIGNYDKDKGAIEIFQNCFTKKGFSVGLLIESVVDSKNLKENSAVILEELSDAGASHIIASNLADIIEVKLSEEDDIDKEIKKIFFYVAGVAGLGIDTALGAFENIMSGDIHKTDLALEIIESAISNEKLKTSLVKLVPR